MNRRKFLSTSGAIILLSGMVGCSSTTEPSARAMPYKETINSVLISSDGKTLVVLGQDYHYIFDLPASLLKTLQGSFHPYVQATISRFTVNASNEVIGNVLLRLGDTPEDAKTAALQAGFVERNGNTLLSLQMHGRRYKASQVEVQPQYQLNRAYIVNVDVAPHVQETHISPVQIAAGVIVIPGIILFAAAVFTNCLLTGQLHNCHE